MSVPAPSCDAAASWSAVAGARSWAQAIGVRPTLAAMPAGTSALLIKMDLYLMCAAPSRGIMRRFRRPSWSTVSETDLDMSNALLIFQHITFVCHKDFPKRVLERAILDLLKRTATKRASGLPHRRAATGISQHQLQHFNLQRAQVHDARTTAFLKSSRLRSET